MDGDVFREIDSTVYEGFEHAKSKSKGAETEPKTNDSESDETAVESLQK